MLGRRKPPPRLPDIPDALVNTNAYLMWVDSGRPEGADFGRASRDQLMKELNSGRCGLSDASVWLRACCARPDAARMMELAGHCMSWRRRFPGARPSSRPLSR